jgi:hypothetical protein
MVGFFLPGRSQPTVGRLYGYGKPFIFLTKNERIGPGA